MNGTNVLHSYNILQFLIISIEMFRLHNLYKYKQFISCCVVVNYFTVFSFHLAFN